MIQTCCQDCSLKMTLRTLRFPPSLILSNSINVNGTTPTFARTFDLCSQKSNCLFQKYFYRLNWMYPRILNWIHRFHNGSLWSALIQFKACCIQQMYRKWLLVLGNYWCLRTLLGMFSCSSFVPFLSSVSLETDLHWLGYCFPWFFSTLNKISYCQMLKFFEILITKEILEFERLNISSHIEGDTFRNVVPKFY